MAQEETPDRTIEELFLDQQVKLQVVRTQAMSTDREMKALALREVGELIAQGQQNPELYDIVEALALDGIEHQVREQGALVNNFPEIRREAVEMLRTLGGERAKNVLLSVLRNDPEPMVIAEAAYGLGQIGLNENSEVSDYMLSMLLRENAKATPDNNLAFSLVISIERLSEQNSGIVDPSVINALLETATSPYIRTVRQRAIEAVLNIGEHG